MAINIGEFKQDEIRAKISVIRNNKEEFVVVRNARGEQRERLLKTWEQLALEGTEESSIIDFTKVILNELTDIEVSDDVDIKDIIDNPTTEMSLILHEVNEVMNEIMTEFWTSKIRQLNQTTITLLTAHASKRTEVMLRLTKELEGSKNSVLELEKALENGALNLPIVQQKLNKTKNKNKKSHK